MFPSEDCVKPCLSDWHSNIMDRFLSDRGILTCYLWYCNVVSLCGLGPWESYMRTGPEVIKAIARVMHLNGTLYGSHQEPRVSTSLSAVAGTLIRFGLRFK